MRVRLARGPAVRWLSPKEFAETIQEALKRAELPVSRTPGDRPRYRIIAGPPLPLGFTSRAEYMDFRLDLPIAGTVFGERLGAELPAGVEVLWQVRVPPGAPHLRAAVTGFRYTIPCEADPERAVAFGEASSWPLVRVRKERERRIDLKQNVSRLIVEPGYVIMDIEVRPDGTPKPEEVLRSIFERDLDPAAEPPAERTAVRLTPLPRPRALDMELL